MCLQIMMITIILNLDDFNRVKLEGKIDIQGSDYINASWVNVSKLE